jgi:hypothetical protein
MITASGALYSSSMSIPASFSIGDALIQWSMSSAIVLDHA